MFNWRSLVSLFAAPLGNIVNRGIAVASTAVITWSVSKGVPGDVVTPIVASIVLAVSTAIAAFATSQGIQIPLINADPTNGVKVVPQNANAQAVNSKQL